MHILKQLSTKKGRDETGLFFVEGASFVAEVPDGWEVVRYVFSAGFAAANGAAVAAYGARAACETLPDGKFAGYADTKTPQGVAAICRKRTWALTLQAGAFYLLCEGLQDPGNVGALIRTAAAAGAAGVLLTPDCADPYGPKVVRASAGAMLRVPIHIGTLGDFSWSLKMKGVPLYAAHPHNGISPYGLDMKKSFCLLIGNEARGLTPSALATADAQICLPMSAATESLNAAMAGSVLLYEAVRQRVK